MRWGGDVGRKRVYRERKERDKKKDEVDEREEKDEIYRFGLYNYYTDV